METLISIFSAVLEFFMVAKKFCLDLVKPLNSVEMVGGLILLAVAVAGIGAFGRRRRPGHLPWD